jgi:hypothetical protein
MRTSHPDMPPQPVVNLHRAGMVSLFESLDFLLDSDLVFAAAGVKTPSTRNRFWAQLFGLRSRTTFSLHNR